MKKTIAAIVIIVFSMHGMQSGEELTAGETLRILEGHYCELHRALGSSIRYYLADKGKKLRKGSTINITNIDYNEQHKTITGTFSCSGTGNTEITITAALTNHPQPVPVNV